MKPVRPTLTYIGVAVTAAGFAMIMYTWGEVAALTVVPLQMPYLVSGGLVGVGLILVGLTLVNINAKRQDAAARERQLGQVREVLSEIRVLLGGEPLPAQQNPPSDEAFAAPEPPPASAQAAADPTEPIPPVSVS